MRRMALIEFGSKLCATAIYVFAISYLGWISLLFTPDSLHLGLILYRIFGIGLLAGLAASSLGAILVLTGYIRKYLHYPPHTN
jgi:hypothetical protein